MILCLMRIPPHPDGHGGNQRAWHLLNALARQGAVHLALVHPATDHAAARVSLDRARAVAASVSVHPIAAWGSASERHARLPWAAGTWIDALTVGSVDAPRLPAGALRRIAGALPQRRFDTVFACRLPLATIADAMLARGLIQADAKLIDIDDVMSQFRTRQLATETPRGGAIGRLVARNWAAARRREIAWLAAEEDRVARAWGAVGLCSPEDVALMHDRVPQARLVLVPNVVDRPSLGVPPAAPFRLLFVGNLGFAPNAHGLARFVREAWPTIRAALPEATFEVVGMAAADDMRALLAEAGVTLSANVPSVVPHYAAASAVIAPIFFGGGTRIKILEAMAFGRPVISTALGAEGLDLVDGEQALLADSLGDMADAVIRVAHDPELALRLARNARAMQQARFGPQALTRGVATMFEPAKDGC